VIVRKDSKTRVRWKATDRTDFPRPWAPRGLDPEEQELTFIRDISPNDGMRMGTSENYYRVGLAALAYIRFSLRLAGKPQPKNILDLPSGYGRVLRMLKAAFPESRLTACDLNHEAVDYCARVFGARPAYSKEDPATIELPGSFDLIWCGSLLTHLDSHRWRGFLGCFEKQLAPEGLVVFTVAGRIVAEEAREGKRRFAAKDLARLLKDYDRYGFGFDPYPNAEFGTAMASPAWVCKEVEHHRDLSLMMYTEGGWDGRQDAVACVRL
jgi:SAM-dependent methyltransferase